MQELLNRFRALPEDEKLAFMREAMPEMAEIFKKDPQKMLATMMPACRETMRTMMPVWMEAMRTMMPGTMK